MLPNRSSLPVTIDLPGGKRLTVRPSEPADADGLAKLYESLSLDDRYHRFFSGSVPKGFVDQWVHVSDRGGLGLVAVEHDGEDGIVAEAGYGLLPDGDGELAVTVAREWRGWLGAYLLDTLVSEAADRGVPNLQAEILLDNGPMLALVRSRGYAVLEGGDWSSLRVTIAASGSRPGWPPADDRPRVLVEAPGGRWPPAREPEASALRIVGCPGPGRERGGCPALAGQPCPLAAHADVIVFAFPPRHPRTRELLAAHERLHAGVPVVAAPPSDPRAPLRVGATTVPACTPAAEILALVAELAGRYRDARAPR